MAVIVSRAGNATTTNTTIVNTSCRQISADEMVLSKTTYTAILTVCILTTITSISVLVFLAVRLYTRRRSNRAARSWGRKSMFNNRISVMRKEIDDSYTRQYKGCWQSNVVENPEMGSDSPVELMLPERVWEVPAVPARPGEAAAAAAVTAAKSSGGVGHKGWKDRRQRMSLFFDHQVGLWIPKR